MVESKTATTKPRKTAAKVVIMDPFHAAFAEMQAELVDPIVDATGQVGNRKYDYVTLLQLLTSIRPVLNKHGFTITEKMTPKDGWIFLKVTIRHGQHVGKVSSTLPIRYVDDPQALGSSITYMRRYIIRALVCVADDRDDDGKKAQEYYQSRQNQPQFIQPVPTNFPAPQAMMPPVQGPVVAPPVQQTYVPPPQTTPAPQTQPTQQAAPPSDDGNRQGEYAPLVEHGEYNGEIVGHRIVSSGDHWTLYEIYMEIVNSSTGEITKARCNTYSNDVITECAKAEKSHDDVKISVKKGRTNKLAVTTVEIIKDI